MIKIENVNKPFIRYVAKVIPLAYDESMSYYECLCSFYHYLRDEVMPVINNNAEATAELQTMFTELKSYVENYFDNLDIQEEVDAKLDDMVESGELQEIIAQYLQLQTTYTYNNIEDLKEAENIANGMFVRTSGYHAYNDGGGAYYKIRPIQVSDVVDDTFIVEVNSNDYVAELIVYDKVNVDQLGAYGDNTHDDTYPIQKALDSNYNITFNTKNYKISKNSDLNYTNHDEPCLRINKEKVVEGNNATLTVEAHAQGIIDINNANNVEIKNLILVSNGGQVSLEGTTGLGEKGSNTAGYNTENIWGIYFNNSYDTSSLTLHGNNGNAWGTFNDGYIGNAGCGILIRNTSHNIRIENCDISGFNYSGIQIGTYQETVDNVDECYNIVIENNTIHNIYNGGIESTSGREINIINNNISNIGHPDALKTDTNQNPGYGITFNGSYKESNQSIVSNNIINNCVRKGIDLHGGNKIIIDSNIVSNCMVGGIFSQTQYNANISNCININNNQVYNCAYATNQLNAIQVEGVPSASSEEQTEKEVLITNNLIQNCGGLRSFIDVVTGKNVIITGNMIKGKTSETTNYATFGILLGLGGRQLSNNGLISNNLINVDNSVTVGIIVNNINDCIVSNNIIKCGSNTTTTNYMSTSKVSCYGNYNTNGKSNESQVGLSIPKVNDKLNFFENQIAMYGDTLHGSDNNKHIGVYGRYISFLVAANSGSNPTISQIWGSSDYLDEVISDTYGFKIKFKNTNNNFNFNAIVSSVSSTPITTTSNVVCEYYYLRTRSKDDMVIGIKENGSSGTHYAISNCQSGTLLVTLIF